MVSLSLETEMSSVDRAFSLGEIGEPYLVWKGDAEIIQDLRESVELCQLMAAARERWQTFFRHGYGGDAHG